MIDYSVSDNVAVLRLQSPPVNAITPAMLDELRAALRRANQHPNIRAVVITGTAEHFSAGADLDIFQHIRCSDDAISVSRMFQEAFQEVEDAPKPVVAAVAGQVLGGALELAMACHFRVAAEGSRFATPEVNLGFNPGAGGTQRLPRLVGLEAALEMLLGGRAIDTQRALALGLIDRVCSGDQLLAAATAMVDSAPIAAKMSLRSDKLADKAALGALLERAEARAAAARPELIAPRQILAAVRAGLEQSFAAGCLGEQEAFGQCVATRATQNKIYFFRASRKTGRIPELAAVPATPIARAGVVGMGTMGTGIAQALITAGIHVTVIDERPSAMEAGGQRIRQSLMRRAEQGKLSSQKAAAALARLTTAADWQSLAGAQLIIEAVFEDVEVKRSVFRRLDPICAAEAILASNTSTFNLDALAEGLSGSRHVIGLHFFHPAQQMPLVEVVRRRATPPEVTATAMGLVKALGKTPVLVENREGFLVDRLFVPYLTEAFWMLEEGASPTEVDRAMVDFGFPMGPIQLIDMAGLDILVLTQRSMQQAFPHHGGLSQIVHRLVEEGFLGQKTGAGVYRYEKGDHTPRPHPAAEEMIAQVRRQSGSVRDAVGPEQIVRRLMLRMVAEAFGLLEEGIVGRPADLDVAIVLGIGLADFRGGVLRYACDLGLDRVLDDLRQLAQQSGPRYAPCPLLERAAADPSVLRL